MKKKTFRIPKHRRCNCYLLEDRDSINLISYSTNVATFYKRFCTITIHGRYSITTDRHVIFFREYIHDRYNLRSIPCILQFTSVAGCLSQHYNYF